MHMLVTMLAEALELSRRGQADARELELRLGVALAEARMRLAHLPPTDERRCTCGAPHVHADTCAVVVARRAEGGQ